MAVGIERNSNTSRGQEFALGKTIQVDSVAGNLEITQTQNGFEVRRANSDRVVAEYKSGEYLTIKGRDGNSTVYHAYSEEDMRAHDLLEPMV